MLPKDPMGDYPQRDAAQSRVRIVIWEHRNGGESTRKGLFQSNGDRNNSLNHVFSLTEKSHLQFIVLGCRGRLLYN